MLWSFSFRRCQNRMIFKNELQRLYITISKRFLFILSPMVWSSNGLFERSNFRVFLLFQRGGNWCPGTMLTGEGWEVGEGWKGVCSVYSVQIIACFSAFSIDHHNKNKKKRKKNTQLQHSHTISQNKRNNRSVLSMLSGVKKASFKLLGANCSGVM